MNHPEKDPRPPALSFAGAAALLLLIAAFCAYPMGAYTPAGVFAGLAFLSLSLAAPESNAAPARIPAPRPPAARRRGDGGR